MSNTKTIAGWAGLATGAAALSVLLFRKRKNGSTLGNDLLQKARTSGNQLMSYGRELKGRLLHDVKGPNGEEVYQDMYDRHFYEDGAGERIYMETN